jgi:ankyrin repeat protein
MVSLLLEYGADIEATNIVGNTPLLLAAMEGRTEVVRLLLNEYARRKTTPKQGRAAMNIAKKLEFQEIVDLLRDVDKQEDTSLLQLWPYPTHFRLHDPNRN